MKVEGCWANSLDDCHGKLSGEHVLSKSLLGEKIIVVEKEISSGDESNFKSSAKKFKLKSLCEGHNNSLSKSDKEIQLFQRALDEHIRPLNMPQPRLPIDGRQLEIWFAKTIVNYTAVAGINININLKEILPLLYYGKQLIKRYGLYVTTPEIKRKRDSDISIMGWVENQELIGGFFSLRHHKFIIALPNNTQALYEEKLSFLNTPEIKYWVGNPIVWHPKELILMPQGN